VRQVAAESAVALLPPTETSFNWIAFARDVESIYFQRETADTGDISVGPILGGAPRLMVKNAMNFGAGISMDGKKLAFIRHPPPSGSTLNVADIDGTSEREIGEGHGPENFGLRAAPSWSPDGRFVTAASWWRKTQYVTALRFFSARNWTPAEEHHEIAIQQADASPYCTARPLARYWYAEMLVARGKAEDLQRAQSLVAEGVRLFESAGMLWYARKTAPITALS
jgi:hypothetical protein